MSTYSWHKPDTQVVTNEAVISEISLIDLLAAQRAHWAKLHTKTFTPEEFEHWIRQIPGCSNCQRNLRRILETLSPRFDDWNAFTWELHNAVNRELSKPEFTWQESCEKWGWNF